MKVSELSGPLLDYWVARAEGWEFFWSKHGHWNVKRPDGDGYSAACDGWTPFDANTGQPNKRPDPWEAMPQFGYSPSTDWAQGGLLLDKFDVSVMCELDGTYWAVIDGPPNVPESDIGAMGPTRLIAACRAIVRSAYSDEVPDEVAG